MGSYNATCGVSNLPITAGEPVKLLLLVPSMKFESYYTDGVYTNFGLPVDGIYDDYGCLDDIKSNVSSLFLETALRELAASGKLKTRRAEKDKAPEIKDLYEIIALIQQEDLAIDVKELNHYYVPGDAKEVMQPVCYMFILESIYRDAIALVKKHFVWGL